MRRNLLLLAGVTILVPLLSQTAIDTPSAQSAGGDRPGSHAGPHTGGKAFHQSGATVSAGNARIQVLTPTLVRMEYSPEGRFTDAATSVVLKRDWKPVPFTAREENGWLAVRSGKTVVRYRLDSGPFGKENLLIEWKDGRGGQTWAPGDSDRNNLGGLVRSLDGIQKDRLPPPVPGILSRSGRFLLDDSRSPVWDSAAAWIAPRKEQESQDWYFFAYGSDYHLALKAFAALCGRIPMIPRYTLGAWVTDLNYEYLPGTDMVEKYRSTDNNLKQMVNRFRSESIPLDVLVLDFAWHKFGWEGGYDWSPIFSDPAGFLSWAHSSGLKVTLNDHPGYGKESVLANRDTHAPEVIRLLNITPPPVPKLSIDLAKLWKFRTDTADAGIRQQWFSADLNDSAWNSIKAGALWEGQGYPNYDGVAWYRKWVALPASLGVDSLFLVFGGVDDEYDLFINGTKIVHRGTYPDHSMYGTQTESEVSRFLLPGRQNLIAMRVNDWGGGGGIGREPVVLSDVVPGGGIRFNLADKRQAEVFMDVLHNPLVDQGVDFWWIDGGTGSAGMPGLDAQMWTNRVFYDFTEKHTRRRAFIFSRYGGWGSHRYPGNFTGDTHSQWDVLAYEVPFTSRGGNVLMPFITHDIGGFLGDSISFDLYARWLQFGAFSPILRLHSAFENPKNGNLRLPWTYGPRGIDLARRFFQLRCRLIPYIYTYSRIASDEALPLVRPLYLEYPALKEAYNHPDEYLFGREILVAPIVDSTGERDVYLPPGQWNEYPGGMPFKGGQSIHVRHPLESMPLFVRAGSLIPMQPDMPFSAARPLDTLIVEVFPGPSGRFRLYEDDGLSLDYLSGKHAWTPLTCTEQGSALLVGLGPTEGAYDGQGKGRAYELRIHRSAQPRSVTLNGHALPAGRWSWDGPSSLLTVHIDAQSIRTRLSVEVR